MALGAALWLAMPGGWFLGEKSAQSLPAWAGFAGSARSCVRPDWRTTAVVESWEAAARQLLGGLNQLAALPGVGDCPLAGCW